MKLIKRALNWMIIIYVIAVLTLSVAAINSNKQVSLNRTSVLSIRSDYLLHALLFVPWMVLIGWRWREKRGVAFFVLALGAGLVLAAVSEGVQYWLPYRAFNTIDLLSNFAGVVIGGIVSIKKVVSSSYSFNNGYPSRFE